jgi:hypothetical protein
MSANKELIIIGLQVNPETTPINLNNGWSIISYLRDNEMAIESALTSINSNIKIVKNNDGLVYIPLLGINTIGNMLPGQGYYINLEQSCILTYPGN